MSGIGNVASALVLNRGLRRLALPATVWFRQTVQLTLRGFAPSNAENLALLVYRALDGTETLVAAATPFTAVGDNAVGALDTNTTEMETVFADAWDRAARTFDMRLYDGQSKELLGVGPLTVCHSGHDYDADMGAGAPTPISGTTLIWGKLALYNGQTYLKNDEDGLWYAVTLGGTGLTTHFVTGNTGIVITP